MSRENVEIVQGWYDAFDRGDFEACFVACDPEIEWQVVRLPLGPQFPGPYVGHEGLRRFWREWLSAWERVSFEYEEMIDAGDHVVAVLSQRLRGRTSGLEMEAKSYAQVTTVRNGKIVRSVFFPTRAEALEAVGLSE